MHDQLTYDNNNNNNIEYKTL